MSSLPKSLNDVAWEQLFEKYNILSKIECEELYNISATQIKEFREPRLMAKFDHVVNLPRVFSDNRLAILPVSRGDYVISHFDAYHKFEDEDVPVNKVSLPTYIQSLDSSNVSSETVALNCAVAAGIISEFLQDEAIVSTVSGRMGSGEFTFNIANLNTHRPSIIKVVNSQIEIDGAYEGVRCLALFEAKRDLSEDFLIRQLYYPFRVCESRLTKPVRPIFLVYSNGIYRLYEYAFEDKNNYNSLTLVRKKNYSVEDTTVNIMDIQAVLQQATTKQEPRIPFPQANSFERVINICELLNEQELSRNEVTELYAFDVRQTSYYTDAAQYLGLVDKKRDGNIPVYSLSDEGKRILNLSYRQRQLAYCGCILSHKAFSDTLQKYLEVGNMPSTGSIISIMKKSNLYNVGSDSTFDRRSSTIKGWLNWIIGLISV